jgi:hypothetical protein
LCPKRESFSQSKVVPDIDFEVGTWNDQIDLAQGVQAIADQRAEGTKMRQEEDLAVYKQPAFDYPVPLGSERALRICDMDNIKHSIKTRCKAEGWVSTYDGTELLPNLVNLYDLNYYLILPSTVPNGVFLKGLSEGDYKKGEVVLQEVTEKWQQYQQPKGVVLEAGPGPDVLIRVTHGRFVAGRAVHIDGVACGVPGFVEFKDGVRLSYKEMLHPEPTKPDWFISHWWGDSVLAFFDRCEMHAQSYCTKWGQGTDSEAYKSYSYWVCAYANNQHELATEIVKSPMKSAFMNALTNSNGCLLMLDENATPFTRIWCDFEIFMTLMDGKTLDITTIDERGHPCLMTQNVLPCDEDAEDKSFRDGNFPALMLAKGATISLEHGDASVVLDKVRILNSMVKIAEIVSGNEADIDWDDHGAMDRITEERITGTEARNYELADNALRSRFGVAAWTMAHAKGCVNNFHEYPDLQGKYDGPQLDLEKITASSELAEQYELTLAGDVTDESFASVVHGIPKCAVLLRIEQHDMEDLSDESFFLMWEKLGTMPNLELYDMKMGNMSDAHSDEAFTDPSRGLAAKITQMKNLTTLILDIEGCTYGHDSKFSDASLHTIGAAITGWANCNLETLKLDLGDERVFQMQSKEDVRTWAADPTADVFRIPRPDHGFGNSLSESEVHQQRGASTRPKKGNKQVGTFGAIKRFLRQ